MRALVRTVAFLVAFGIAVVGGAALWFRHEVTAVRTLPTHEVRVVVPRGATGHDVARLLATKGVIASPLAFEVLARIRREQSAMKAGEFLFAPHRTAGEILQAVVGGGAQTAVWVTIPEGYTSKEVARALADRHLGSDAAYERAFGTSIELYGTRTKSLEGYLYPDSYLIPNDASPARVVRILTDAFRAKLPRDAAARARALGLTVPQVVTVASLVEREAKVDRERPLMAGVYYNRLRRGMPLEVDATIEYTFARHKTVITFADLASDSPYNTYKHVGLPPTPIANPGQPSLDAAFHPQKSDYYYYVYAGNGRSAFARTLAEHNANVARYLR
ncbi:MAG: endolytic transglycosylase MltG [Vulcanimicrobiaceae bacterium]